MAALVGRNVTFTPQGSGVTVTGARTKTVSISNDGIDITSDDDSGWQTFLESDPAQRAVNMTVEGVTKDDQLIALAMAGGANLVASYDLEFEGLGTFSGDFYFGSIELGAPYNDAVTFSATIQSSGEITWTPA